MKTNYYLLLLLLCYTSQLSAQRIIPLPGYDFLARETAADSRVQARMDCSFDNLDLNRVRDGERGLFPFEIDTVGFNGPNSAFRCLNCDQAAFGIAGLDGQELEYEAVTNDQGFDTLQIAFGDTLTNNYTEALEIVVLAQRQDATINNPVMPLGPQQEVEQLVTINNLPGEIFCREFVDDDDYPGRGQIFFFLEDITESQNFSFQSARLAGLDRLGVKVCNEFGLCDTYYYFFRVERQNIFPPFFDDFSNIDIRTDALLWQDEDVFVNNTFGFEPPSLGMVTFDGVGPYGQPYPLDGGSGSQPRDFLTSAGINLGGGSGYVLTFYAQPRGLANRPEVNDSLVLQFLDPSNNWNTVWSQAGLSTGEPDDSERPFIGHVVPLDPIYQYNGFQFRFYNRSDETGALDNWHLDYVRLDDLATDLSLADIALVQPPRTVTAPYTSLPYRHLVAAGPAEVQEELLVKVWNHASGQDLRVNSSSLKISEINTGTSLFNTNLLDGPEGDIMPGLPIEKRFDMPSTAPFSAAFPDYQDLLLGLPNVGEEVYRVRTNYTILIDEETDRPGIEETVRSNNLSDGFTVFDNYFAYDDGTAELAVEAFPGQTVVQEYRTYVPDVLKGVSLRLARNSGNVASQTLEIQVYLDTLDFDPEYSFSVQPIYVENFFRDSIQGFTTYELPDSLDLPVGKFYVGWKQLGTCNICVPVGYDRNNDPAGRIFFRNNGNWFALGGPVTGAVMIRPLVGSQRAIPTSTEPEPLVNADNSWFTVFPNPARERAFLQGVGGQPIDPVDWELYDANGRQLRFGRRSLEVNLIDLPSGLYLLRVIDPANGRISQQKLLVNQN